MTRLPLTQCDLGACGIDHVVVAPTPVSNKLQLVQLVASGAIGRRRKPGTVKAPLPPPVTGPTKPAGHWTRVTTKCGRSQQSGRSSKQCWLLRPLRCRPTAGLTWRHPGDRTAETTVPPLEGWFSGECQIYGLIHALHPLGRCNSRQPSGCFPVAPLPPTLQQCVTSALSLLPQHATVLMASSHEHG